MDLGLRGKRAAVSGASRGIGRAIAEHLAAEGCAVSICARDAGQVREAAANISAAAGGTQVVGSVADIGDGDSVRAWLDGAGETRVFA